MKLNFWENMGNRLKLRIIASSLIATTVIGAATKFTSNAIGTELKELALRPNASIDNTFFYPRSPIYQLVSFDDLRQSLTWAIRTHNNDLAKAILDANFPLRRGNGYSSISMAAAVGNMEMVQLLLDRGMKIDGSDFANGEGVFPLMGAVLGNQISTAKFLIHRGANVNQLMKFNPSLLSFARRLNHKDLAEALEAAGGKTDVRDDAKWEVTSRFVDEIQQIRSLSSQTLKKQ